MNHIENPHLGFQFLIEAMFSPKECQTIIELDGDFIATRSQGYEKHNYQPVARNEYTTSRNKNINHSPENYWIFERLGRIANQINDMYYHFEVDQFYGTQVFEYHTDDFMDWHVDIGPTNTSTRKISIVILLSDEKTYDGGKLIWFPQSKDFPPLQGSVILFPSYMPHRVEPVTRGTRYSFVTWLHGPAFR